MDRMMIFFPDPALARVRIMIRDAVLFERQLPTSDSCKDPRKAVMDPNWAGPVGDLKLPVTIVLSLDLTAPDAFFLGVEMLFVCLITANY